MSRCLRVRRALPPTPLAVLLVAALAACDVDVLAPAAVVPAGLAPAGVSASAVGADASVPKFKAGQYAFNGCFSEADALDPGPLAPATVSFDPPVCIPVTLDIAENGWWSLGFDWYSGYTFSEHPGWTFWVYDLWGFRSRNQKCTGGLDMNIVNFPVCLSETRFTRQTSFSSYVEAPNFGTWYRARVTWSFSPRKS